MDFDTSNKRLAKNTVLLYLRMFISMAISLYTSRVTLQYLGVENYGIYNVIGGVVVFVTIISAAFSNSTQRFLALALGKKDDRLLRKYFITIENIHLFLALTFLTIAELIAGWLIEEYLTIPGGRIDDAYIVFHLSVLTMIFSLITIPFQSLLIAAERLALYAYIGISEQVLKLVGLLILIRLSGNSLILYTCFIFALSFFVRILYSSYCTRYYKKVVHYSLEFDKKILKEIWSFVSWAYLGSFSGIAKEQGVNIIIGHYFGVTINAARGVSMQVYNAVTAFGNSFISALRPQIVKSYGAGDIEHSINLTSKGIKITFFLMYLMILPLILECSFVLNIWLVDVPDKAVVFTQLVLCLCILRSMQDPICTLYLAIGKIKKSQIISVILTLLSLVLCILVFAFGLEAETSVWVSMLIEIINMPVLCYLLSELIKVNWPLFIKNSLLPILKVVLITIPILLLFVHTMEEGVLRFFILVPFSVLLNVISMYCLGLDKSEREMVLAYVHNKLTKK